MYWISLSDCNANNINLREKDEKDEKRPDPLGEKLLKSRIIMITDEINKKLAQSVIAQLLLLEQDDPSKEIKVFMNSPGGDADAGFAIYDMMKFVKPKIVNICAGVAASAAVLILLGADSENRVSLPNSRILIHQPRGGFQGQATDIDIHAQEILRMRNDLNKILAMHTGQNIRKIKKDTERDYFMNAEEAKKYGIIDKVLKKRANPDEETDS